MWLLTPPTLHRVIPEPMADCASPASARRYGKCDRVVVSPLAFHALAVHEARRRQRLFRDLLSVEAASSAPSSRTNSSGAFPMA